MNLVFATNNPNKLSELQALVPDGIEILSLKDINCNEELPETNPTLEENALQKAQYVYQNYGFNCFADDTGLEIEALGGAPGVYSARYAGGECKAEDNMKKVLSKLKNEENRNAKFRTVIALIIKGEENLFQGECNGKITITKIGVEGFGYDPIFIPEGYEITFAEMSKKEKGAISHRGKVVEKLVSFLHC
ncbi:MAG: non-canonical purine NTP diphosphatase [Flavobacteriales bacterium]|jgi:XTP/dITP diphosphohydrolase|nr:non-canonical purine NTP diphosphatase [Flavobacteriales bacterium]MBT5089854.1 non-canonical purine NTP diphosphatase [Flavobacteriales bacterium]MBT5749726.1 non-canonical purine NTP diphosphatase [Flavobacteriales bacterium]